eukprot:1408718-Pyramimonas_sp.AAC.2
MRVRRRLRSVQSSKPLGESVFTCHSAASTSCMDPKTPRKTALPRSRGVAAQSVQSVAVQSVAQSAQSVVQAVTQSEQCGEQLPEDGKEDGVAAVRLLAEWARTLYR